MNSNIDTSTNTSAFVSGIKFSSKFDTLYIKAILLELFTQFTIIKDIQVVPTVHNKLEQEQDEPIKQYSAIVSLHNEDDLNHLLKIWGDIRNFVKINGFTISIKKYNNKNYSLNTDKFISYAVVAIYNIIDILMVEPNNSKKDMIDYIDQEVFETRFSKLKQFLQDKVGVKDINPQLQFLPLDNNKYKPFIIVHFDNFLNADSFISAYNNLILFDNKNLEVAYAYKDVTDKSIGQYGDSLQRSLEDEVTST